MERRTLFIADIHGNYEALDHVLADYEKRECPLETTSVVCLGDVVGYGARPADCVKRLKSIEATTVMGNHDAAVVGEVSPEWFNRMAREAVRWTRDNLESDHVDWLSSLPRHLEHNGFECVHGSPSDPLAEYITSSVDATRAVNKSDRSAVVSGHTHVPAMYHSQSKKDDSRLTSRNVASGDKIHVDPSKQRLAVNPGSVGQPRDGDPRASYLVWNREKSEMVWSRTSYPVEETQTRIREAGLPEQLASRLAVGT